MFKKNGFTLLEVLIALAICGAVLLTVIHTLNHHLSVAQRQEYITVASLLAHNKMVEMEKTRKEEKGNFPEPFSNFSYKTYITSSPYPNVEEFGVVVKIDKEKINFREYVHKR